MLSMRALISRTSTRALGFIGRIISMPSMNSVELWPFDSRTAESFWPIHRHLILIVNQGTEGRVAKAGYKSSYALGWERSAFC